MFASNEVSEHFTRQRIRWTFNLERAPWWGGFFERMVKSVKRCLKKTLGNSSLTFDELLMALVEIEAVLNSRPLSLMSSSDIQEPLTPSHLMMGHRLLSIPTYDFSDEHDFNTSVHSIDLTRKMLIFRGY
jgi:hypothetical protein